ncbi:MAG: hypothetical protein JHC87_09025 [Thermoleophilaceae bacterium]|nr:hypothetical protein [Thermoleophilaceae bacterium]MBJ7348696.1 hypothetical protein [Thermoleophilaceae bacterium]
MATASTEQSKTELTRLQVSEAKAWGTYSKSLEGLSGEAYQEAEGRSWDRLQRKLGEIESRRTELCGGRSTKTS